MIMDNSKTTSKTTLLKLMLLRAWKERWTDCQWGINVKTILTRGVSGDVYNLADAIIQQAVVGSGANMLFLSYLKHSLCAHLISHAAVLNRIAKYDQFDKQHCLIALLDFLKSIIDGVTCRGKQEEAILTKATVSLVHWLLQIYECVLKSYAEARALQTEEEEVVQRVAAVLERIVENPFLLGVLSIGKCDDPELFIALQKRFNGINNLTLTTGYVAHVGSNQKNVTVTDYMRKLVLLEVDILEMKLFDGGKVEPITYSLQPLLAIEVLLNPMCDTHQYVAQLINLKRLKGYSYARLYCEIMRGCLISLNNVEGTAKESLLCAFAFIKVPHILHQIHTKTNGKEQQDEATGTSYSVEVLEAFELLLQDAPVLDYMDMKCACNVLECLLKEMVKHKLLTETHVKHFVALREPVTLALQKLDSNNAPLTLMLKFVFRVESPLVGILKALSTDCSKVQDALLAMLCQVLTGNSLDLVLSVASVEGKFKAFISGLLKCNDYAKQATSVEIGKASATRGALFDVTFMILASIAQSYGSDVILAEGGNSFFEKWVRDYMVERKKTKSPTTMVKQADPMVLEELIMTLNNSEAGGGLSTSNLRWEDICYTIPALLQQVLMAWENETIAPLEIKKMLDRLKAHFSSFAVCAASWLCAYMQMVRQDEQLKPMNMVQQLCSALTGQQAEEWQQQDYCKERFGLMSQIIRRMQQEFMRTPQINPKLRALFPSQHMVSHLPLEEQFEEAWKAIAERGWLPIETTFLLDTLLQSCGPSWLVEKLVGKLFMCKYIRDLNKMMDIIFAIMHLDIERCTIALLSQLVPMMLLNKTQTPEIIDPQSRVLAKLCVYCIIVTMEASFTTSKKRTRGTAGSELEDLDSLCSSAKLRKIELDGMGVGCEATGAGTEFTLDGAIEPSAPASWEAGSVPTLKEPLQSCLQTLFRTFTQYITTDELSPKVYFVFQFLSLLVESGRERIMCVLKLIPNGLVQNLLKINATDEMTVGLLLSMTFDETTHIWRGSPMAPLYNPAQGLGELLHRLLQRTPTRIAQISVDTGRSITYHQLHLWSIRFAQSLTGFGGLGRGDLVTVVARNGEQLAAVVFGCFMAAIPLNTLDPTFRSEDYEHMLRTVVPKAVICDSELLPVLKKALDAVGITPQLIVIGKRINGYPTVDDFLLPNGLEEGFVPQHVEDPAHELAIVLCSSGTTGLSKGVCLSHAICIAHTANLWRATDCERVLCFSSLYWVSGLGVLLNATTVGATRIITRESFSARLLIDLVEQFRITTLFMPPAQALTLLGDATIGMADFSSLQLVLCGGGIVSGELKASFEKYLPKRAKFIVGYGLSEIGGGCFTTVLSYKAGAIGTPNAGMEAKVVDGEGTALQPGEEGELLVRAAYAFLEYYGNPVETEKMLDEDGWLHTGDIARYDEDGVFFVVDRKKDIIKYAGYQISPTELESTIMQLFAGSLLMVCVTGIPVPGNDLPVVLAVRQHEGTTVQGQDIVDGLAEVVADFKRLRGGVFFVDSLPMTPSGKIVRRRCKEMAIALLYDLNTPTGRQFAMSDICLLRNIQMRKESIKL
uniref:Mediator of RNA polymerase II transcription subunit 24 n=1 Tax=Anopheles epiroticus TaxID=199890 RepID=A0A182P6E2_9DIPT